MTIIDQGRPSSFESEVRHRIDSERAMLAQARREQDDIQQVISSAVIHDLKALAERNDVELAPVD